MVCGWAPDGARWLFNIFIGDDFRHGPSPILSAKKLAVLIEIAVLTQFLDVFAVDRPPASRLAF